MSKCFQNHDVEKVKKFQRSNAGRFMLFRNNHREYIQDATLNTNRCENRNAENH